MQATANWFTSELQIDEGPDPFSEEDLGNPIDLENPEAVLNARLTETLRQMNNLYEVGITCDLLIQADHTCHACPVSQAQNKNIPLGSLCRTGLEQERVIAEMNVEKARNEGRLP